MKRLIFLMSFTFLILQSCDDDDLCLRGGGTLETFTLNLDDFDRVELTGPVNLRITQGAEQEVTVEAENELFSAMDHEVKNGTLEIGFEGNVRCFETSHGVWVNITVPDLERIKASGQGEIISQGDIMLDRLEFNSSGSYNLSLSGEVDEMTVDVSGIIEATNFDLITSKTFIDISGSADLEVNCTDVLDLKVSGSAVVKYKGSPQITQDISGSLELLDRN